VTSFLSTRKQQNTTDFVSIVVFDDAATTLSEIMPAAEFLREKITALSDHVSGQHTGTKVSEGLSHADTLISYTPDGHKTLLLILSDGDLPQSELKASRVKLAAIFEKPISETLELMTLGFGKQNHWENLKELAITFNGKFHQTPDTLTLNNVLEEKTLGTDWSVLNSI